MTGLSSAAVSSPNTFIPRRAARSAACGEWIPYHSGGLDPPETVSVVRSGFRLASGDPAPASPPPALGADTEQLLTELGYSKTDIEALARDKAI